MTIERRTLAPAGQAMQCTRAMAVAMSVDLAEVLHLGGLSAAEYAGMITRCRGCAQAEPCAAWLEDKKPDASDALLPPFQCDNKDVLSRFAQVFG